MVEREKYIYVVVRYGYGYYRLKLNIYKNIMQVAMLPTNHLLGFCFVDTENLITVISISCRRLMESFSLIPMGRFGCIPSRQTWEIKVHIIMLENLENYRLGTIVFEKCNIYTIHHNQFVKEKSVLRYMFYIVSGGRTTLATQPGQVAGWVGNAVQSWLPATLSTLYIGVLSRNDIPMILAVLPTLPGILAWSVT